jgi:polyphosphate kinase 2 (PPK2 family)
VLGERVDERVEERVWREGYDEINTFERHLTADGYVVVKCWLHIDKKEQKRRFDALRADPAFAWKVGPDEIRRRKQWNLYYEAVEEMLERTSTGSAPWTVVESTDRRFRIVKVMETVIGAMSQALKKREHEQAAVAAAPPAPATAAKAPSPRAKKAAEEAPPPPAPAGALASSNPLDRVDLTRTLSVEEYREQLPELQERLRRLEHEAYMARVPVVIVYQGWDAAGKGGNIKRLTNGMDPRGYEVVPIAAPTLDEKANHWLRRFWTRLPKAGHITIFDRSWYERILVERIEHFCTEDDWRRAYQEINEFEAALASYGTAMVKLWIHISDEEQLARFDERMNTPYKRWKITDEDWRNREKWGVYYEATGDMILRTSTTYAPWTIIEGNCKLWARIKALKTVAKAIEGGLAS